MHNARPLAAKTTLTTIAEEKERPGTDLSVINSLSHIINTTLSLRKNYIELLHLQTQKKNHPIFWKLFSDVSDEKKLVNLNKQIRQHTQVLNCKETLAKQQELNDYIAKHKKDNPDSFTWLVATAIDELHKWQQQFSLQNYIYELENKKHMAEIGLDTELVKQLDKKMKELNDKMNLDIPCKLPFNFQRLLAITPTTISPDYLKQKIVLMYLHMSATLTDSTNPLHADYRKLKFMLEPLMEKLEKPAAVILRSALTS